MADQLPLFDLINKARTDVVDAVARAYDLAYAEGFAKGFAEGGAAAMEQVEWQMVRLVRLADGETLVQRRFTLDDLRKADEMDRRAKENKE